MHLNVERKSPQIKKEVQVIGEGVISGTRALGRTGKVALI